MRDGNVDCPYHIGYMTYMCNIGIKSKFYMTYMCNIGIKSKFYP